MRLWSKKGHVFQVEVNDTRPRHGYNHTLTANCFDSEMQERTTPALHASLKASMQRTVLKAKTSVAWSSMQEDAVNTCMTIGEPGGGATQFRGDQRSSGGGDCAAARTKIRANATTALRSS
jgi:hypothetical protein